MLDFVLGWSAKAWADGVGARGRQGFLASGLGSYQPVGRPVAQPTGVANRLRCLESWTEVQGRARGLSGSAYPWLGLGSRGQTRLDEAGR